MPDAKIADAYSDGWRDALTAVRELHKPVVRRFTALNGKPGMFVHCHGCDQGPRVEDYPDWPCRTADLVYTPEEIGQETQGD
jgi:hypothetical protein